MKRFHVHLHVEDLDRSIGFYSRLFGAAPARVEADYAKWMLDDPAVNFAISTRGEQPGIDHLGIQADDAESLQALKVRAEAADRSLLDEGETTCCYARSDKHWVTDPQGIAWEHFHTLADIPVFREARPAGASQAACCAPAAQPTAGRASAQAPTPDRAPTVEPAACCAPTAGPVVQREAVRASTGCCPPAATAAAASPRCC